MAHMPNQVTVHIVQKELADQLEELAVQYEEVVQTLRWQAENLRSGFDLTLDVRATQVTMKTSTPEHTIVDKEEVIRQAEERLEQVTREELDGDVSDEEVKAVFDNHEGINLLPLEPRDPEMAKQWRKGSHFLPWGNHITTCGIDTQGQVRMSWDENKGDWVHPIHPTTLKARTTAKLKYVDCPDCRELIRDTFNEPEKSNIEWLMSGFDEDEEE